MIATMLTQFLLNHITTTIRILNDAKKSFKKEGIANEILKWPDPGRKRKNMVKDEK